jgi:CheY-like chemotaxis protein
LNDDECGCNATVLLADDNPFNLIPLRVLLEENYSIYCDLVENGKLEVESFKFNMEKVCCNVRYRLVLTDLNMPVMDGFEAARQILNY